MSYQTITSTTDAGLTVITMNRPEVMNALNRRMRQELTEALTEAGASSRAVVLTGTGRGFSSGQDLVDAGPLDKLDLERTLREEYEPMLLAITDCPVPTIAAVNGVAAGAGANLALAADVVIASESASFIQAFTRIGLMPDAGGTYWLPRQMGFARAMGAVLFADAISARQAADWGMIWEVVADADFEAHWRTRAAKLAAGPTVAYKGIKDALRGTYDRSLAEQLGVEAAGQGTCGRSGDFREGVMAFIGKRPATFQGR
jgi:2-(1,2-epoxy-1,2-dihydrophenyl)acetyl-CoA isomerase